MKSDFEIITYRFDKPVYIYPIADMHYGAINHQKAEWEAFVQKLSEEEDSYIILNGDLINNNTRSSVGSPFDDILRPRDQKIAMTEYLKPIKDKILCIVSGNHEQRSLRDADDDPAHDIACKLDIEDRFRQNAAFLRIGVGNRNKGEGRVGSKQTYTFAVTHGSGGGIYTGATVNRNERWGNILDGIDCVVVGHSHKGTVTRPTKLVVSDRYNTVQVRDYLVISCTSWQAYGEYAMRKMMLPTITASPQQLYLHQSQRKISVNW